MLDPMPQVLIWMGAGDANRLGHRLVQILGVLLPTEVEPWKNAPADIQVLVGDEHA